MKKRLLALLLSVITMLSTTACVNEMVFVDKQLIDASKTIGNSHSKTTNQSNVKDVVLTYPSEFFQERWNPNEFIKIMEEEGSKNSILNKDGSLTIVFSEKKYDEMIVELYKGLGEALKEIEKEYESEEFIKNITYTKDFSEINIELYKGSLNSLEQEQSIDAVSMLIAMFVSGGKAFMGQNIDTQLKFTEVETGKEIALHQYPDYFEKAADTFSELFGTNLEELIFLNN